MERNTEQRVPDDLPLGPGLTQQQAEAIYEQGKEAVVFALLQLAKMATESRPANLPAAIARDPSTPSAQKPVFTKANKETGKRRKRPGRKKGHVGVRRGRPEWIDRTVEHRAPSRGYGQRGIENLSQNRPFAAIEKILCFKWLKSYTFHVFSWNKVNLSAFFEKTYGEDV